MHLKSKRFEKKKNEKDLVLLLAAHLAIQLSVNSWSFRGYILQNTMVQGGGGWLQGKSNKKTKVKGKIWGGNDKITIYTPVEY